jgi:23S rRNA (adenine-N6)-dimethyltransferase
VTQRSASTLWRTQNFLRDDRTAARIVALASVGRDDTVYEVGAGAGALTEQLALRSRRVIAVEKDPGLAAALRRRFAPCPHVEVRHADALRDRLPSPPYKVVANPPFDALTALVARLLGAPAPPEDVWLAVQREAADRYVGRPAETLVALLLKPWFAPTVEHRFRRTDFAPVPSVDVVLLRLRKRGPPLVRDTDARLYRDLVTAVVTAWRPTVAAALADLLGRRRAHRVVDASGVDAGAAPSRVRFEDWLALFEAFAATSDAQARRAVDGAEPRLRRQQARLVKQHPTRRALRRGDREIRPGETRGTRGPPAAAQAIVAPTRACSGEVRSAGGAAAGSRTGRRDARRRSSTDAARRPARCGRSLADRVRRSEERDDRGGRKWWGPVDRPGRQPRRGT